MTATHASKKDEVLVIGGQVFNMVFFSHMRDILKQNAGSASDEGPWPPVTIVNLQIDDEVLKRNFKIAIIEMREKRLAEDWARCEYVQTNYPLCQIVVVCESDIEQLQVTHALPISSGMHFCEEIGEAIEHVWQDFKQPVM